MDTAVHERDYTLTLPGEWRKKETKPEGPNVYRTPAGTEQVTITLLWSSAAQDSATQMETLKGVVEKHRQAVLQAYAPTQAKLSGANFVERPKGPWASYFILDPSTGSISFVRIVASAWTVGTVVYEQRGLAPEIAHPRGLKILGSFALTGAPPGARK